MTTQPLVTQDWAGPRFEPQSTQPGQWRTLRLVLVAVDALVIAVAFGLAYLIRFNTHLLMFFAVEEPPYAFYTSLVFLLIPVWLMVFGVHRLYDFNQLLGGMDEYVRVVQATSMGMMIVIVFSFLEPRFIIARGWLLLTWLLAIAGVIAARFTIRHLVYASRTKGRFITSVLIIGANEEGRAIAEHLRESPTTGAQVIGFLDDRVDEGREVTIGLRILGPIDDALKWIERYSVNEVIVASSALTRAELLDIYQVFGLRDDVTLRMSSGLFEMMTTGMRIKQLGSVALLSPSRTRLSLAERAIKKIFDLTLTTAALIVFSPLMIALAVLVKLDSPGPILHRRRVLGADARPFNAFKFRTMHVNGDEILARYPELAQQLAQNMKLKDDPRVTRAGKWLRKLSLDELPQLFNVLLGQMSLVGPRMITPEEAERYGKWRMNLLTVKPGITGLWQVSGRSDVSYPERVQIDMNYIRNYSLWLDLILLARTVPVVFKKTGAY